MDGHIYIFVPDPQTHGPHGPTCKRTDGHTDGRTDTHKHGRTCRRADGHAEVRTQTHGRRSRSTDADARMQTQAPDGARTLNISKSILPTYVRFSRGRSHIYICTGPADARPAWPDLQTHGRTHRRADGHAEAWTDTQTGGRTRRSTDADARTQTQKHGRRRRCTDADASARWCTDAKYSCMQCVGGKIVQTRPVSGRTRKDLRDVLYIE